MDAGERRERVLALLRESGGPVSASALAKEVSVSRQVIVGDIALLRAAGTDIQATPRGYLLGGEEKERGKLIRTIACRHDREGMGEELYTVVDNGAGVIDVIVEHPVYGQISGKLHIFSRFDVRNFLSKVAENNAAILCDLTNHVHLHTISCHSQEEYCRVLSELDKKGILFQK